MKIHLEYVAMLDVRGARSGAPLEVPEGATVGALLEQLHVKPEHRKTVTPFVNEQRATTGTALKDGDRVFLALPISGG
jgi:sulfur carrier protein ThiS